MGDGMKFTIDQTNTIIFALEELKGYQAMEFNEINGLIKRFKKSAKLKEIYEKNVYNEYAALKNLKVGEQLTVKYNAQEDLMHFIDIIKEKWDVEMKFDYSKGWNVRRVA